MRKPTKCNRIWSSWRAARAASLDLEERRRGEEDRIRESEDIESGT